MNYQSIIILVLVIAAFAAAVIYSVKHKNGCGGDCSSCRDCTNCKNEKK